MRARGFSTLAALACLLVLTVSVLTATGPLRQTAIWLDRASRLLKQEAQAREDTLALVRDLAKNAASDPDPWVDRAAKFKAPDGRSATVTDMSARINLNAVTRFVLADSALVSSLTGTVDAWWTFRDKQGPQRNAGTYAPFFQKTALDELFTASSRFNINTVDETVLETIVKLRTGDEGLASLLRDRLRRLREQGGLVDAQHWQQFLGPGFDALSPLLTVDPDLNVSTASPRLLEAVISYPPWHIPLALEKAAALVSDRLQGPLTPLQVKQILGVRDGHPVLSYLGTESWLAEGRWTLGDRQFRFVVLRQRDSGGFAFRVVEQGWIS